MTPKFLTVEQVLDLHATLIDHHGGSHGLRDPGLLESAVMAPQQTFGGELLYKSLAEMAVAYWIGLVGNHPFVDGNKRVGLFAFDTFLLMNGRRVGMTNDEAVGMTLRIACGEHDRQTLVEFVESRIGAK